jgi:REP element-mobilizing transposase RayT
MSRGNGGQAIYTKRADFTAFLDCLKEACARYDLAIHSFCLMTNHYHLVVETPHGNLGAAMHWLNSSYVRRHHRVHQRRGHLFQRRYKALLVDADTYLTWLSRYIHLNPVRAEIVASPAAYRWSSYRPFIDKARIQGWLQTDLVLGRFGKIRKSAQVEYRRFVEGTQGDIHDEKIAHCLREGEMLGGDSFRESLEKLLGREQVASQRLPARILPIDAVLDAVSDSFQLPVETLLEKGQKRNIARDVAIYLAWRECDLSGRDLGSHFGGISSAAVSMRCRVIRKALPRNIDLRTRLSRIEANFPRPQ